MAAFRHNSDAKLRQKLSRMTKKDQLKQSRTNFHAPFSPKKSTKASQHRPLLSNPRKHHGRIGSAFEFELKQNWKVGSACAVLSRSMDEWVSGTIIGIEGKGKNERMVVKYGPKGTEMNIQRNSEDIVPLLQIGSLCSLLCTRKWYDAVVYDIEVDDEGEWLKLKGVGKHGKIIEFDDIERWWPYLYHRPKSGRVSQRLLQLQAELLNPLASNLYAHDDEKRHDMAAAENSLPAIDDEISSPMDLPSPMSLLSPAARDRSMKSHYKNSKSDSVGSALSHAGTLIEGLSPAHQMCVHESSDEEEIELQIHPLLTPDKTWCEACDQSSQVPGCCWVRSPDPMTMLRIEHALIYTNIKKFYYAEQ